MSSHVEPIVIPRPEHNISRANISENALKVLRRLKGEGFQAHLVGGGVRDLLLGREPKDFDVATDASPEEVRKIFRNCRLVGRRFRLAHVHFGREIIEVATFRGMSGNGNGNGDSEELDEDNGHELSDNGMILSDNVYGTIEDDALRRDFTVNALYYNIADFSVIDYADGMRDLKDGVLRLMGDPETRYREDPVRMLRAVRFAAKLGFNIDPATEKPLTELGPLLQDIPPARLFEEILKLFMAGTAVHSFEKLRHYDLFRELFPQTDECLSRQEQDFPITFVYNGLKNTDTRVREGLPVTPAFLFAVLLWEPVRQRAEGLQAAGEAPIPAYQRAADEVVSEQIQQASIPRRFSTQMREIWVMQVRMENRTARRAMGLVVHARFRAAYDFLLLRAESGEADPELAAWWTEFQAADEEGRLKLAKPAKGKSRRRRRRKKKPAEGNSGGDGQ